MICACNPEFAGYGKGVVIIMWDNFIISMEIMAKGMGSIFAVIILLTLIVLLLQKFPAIWAVIVEKFKKRFLHK